MKTGFLVGKTESKRPLGRPRSRWDDNIKMDLIELYDGEMDSIDLAQGREVAGFVNAKMDVRFPQNAEDFLSR